MRRLHFLFVLMACLIFVSTQGHTAPLVPSPLVPWKSWVLYGHENRVCPTPYNNADTHQSLWPSHLKLEVFPSEGRFSQQWLVFKPSLVPPPGSPTLWPQEVKEGAKILSVIEKNGRPVVQLTSGEHIITGRLQIQARPGQWNLRVAAYLKGHVRSIRPVLFIGSREVWCFKPQSDIRMVKIKGVPAIDPRKTGLPLEWKRYTF